MSQSLALRYAKLTPEERAVYRAEAKVSEEELARDWRFWARPEQLAPPGDHLWWLVLGGRGSGKTRTGAEWCVDRLLLGCERGGLVGRTAGDCRLIMLDGESGLGEVCDRRGIHYKHQPSRRRVELRMPGTRGHTMRWTTYTAEEPDQLAGPQHDSMWGDEFAGWAPILDGAGRSTLDNAEFGLRLGKPQGVLTSTPRPSREVKALVARVGRDIVMTGGSLFDNAMNLPVQFIKRILDRYQGTRLGQQEIYGKVLDDLGWVFRRHWFEEMYVREPLPRNCPRVRYWDLAATEPHPQNLDPDYTAGMLMAYSLETKRWRIEDVVRGQLSPANVLALLKTTAEDDGRAVTVYLEEDKGAAGRNLTAAYKREVFAPMGIICFGNPVSGSKEKRAALPAGAAQQRRIEMVRAPWNPEFLDEVTGFPEWPHDDQVDILSGAFQMLADDGRPRVAPAVSGAKLLERGPVVTR